MSDKKRILSGIQPSGPLTLGNYVGALRNWVELQKTDEYECFFMLADMHTITVRQTPKDFRKNAMDLLALFLACGLDPEKSPIFFQSHVPAHAQLSWVLTCNTYMGELSRMTQFKDKSRKHSGNINAGLFTYPSLMAADILLYQADLVPVGEDQKQHLELTRDLANRFNNAYSETFKVPEGYIPKVGARIMSLQDPSQKMSKSDPNENGYILMLDDPDVIVRKIKRAVTDSGSDVCRGENKAGIENLMNIYSAVTGMSLDEIERNFAGKGYGDFKNAVAESVAEALRPIQKRYHDLMANKDYLEQVYRRGAEIASRTAGKTLSKVYRKVGFIQM
ncbi:tryptophan--tRNA ligase [Ructibacterium gallinarum]|uniref:Tryptophan--tRNA ligase n=1 Tax=Ructibacterium gallinarum TaxID=2779355 RepID=A0A9D5LYE2_9FIRM|nr:tryptophan--tRNA ligase [Ructibacterium gallinarum]MBE5040276.1 tryptophan--tRNA ligase [Ructibacterium gallinarum]